MFSIVAGFVRWTTYVDTVFIQQKKYRVSKLEHFTSINYDLFVTQLFLFPQQINILS